MTAIPPALSPIDLSNHTFTAPAKRIHTQDDLPLFHASPAYKLITSFLVHLNSSVCPVDAATNVVRDPAEYVTESTAVTVSPDVQKIITLIHDLEQLISSAPPDTAPRRFGNVAFRKWHALVKERLGIDGDANPALSAYLPDAVLSATGTGVPATSEILPYLISSFGSPERLDYGTGHELSFAAFLCGIWMVGGFEPSRDEKALVLRCFDAYFRLVRRLVKTYSLEPAGSHGVWGLDDHSFLPYIFGSSQLTTYRPTTDAPGNDYGLPKPTDVVKQDVVERERERNLYFGAIGFIYDVKKGPFWEHSPILFDISGVQKGWGKINEVCFLFAIC